MKNQMRFLLKSLIKKNKLKNKSQNKNKISKTFTKIKSKTKQKTKNKSHKNLLITEDVSSVENNDIEELDMVENKIENHDDLNDTNLKPISKNMPIDNKSKEVLSKNKIMLN